MNKPFEVTFLGTNGSCAYNNGKRRKYGSNTPCVAVRAGEETIVFDAGSGICGFPDLTEYQKKHIHLFFSHYHMDHIDGLLFFSYLFDPDKTIDIYGYGDVREILNDIISPPLFPVGTEGFRAATGFHNVNPGEAIRLSDEVTVSTCSLSHPGNALGYRVEYDGKVFCYCDDVELINHQNDKKLQSFTRNADLLVLDSAFADGKVITGWGHSSPGECARWAMEADAKKMALYHYNYNMTDADINAMEKAAQSIFSETFAATDGMRIVL
jgi:phosphoribosyl 1,2-cyclic phosphodiesterase